MDGSWQCADERWRVGTHFAQARESQDRPSGGRGTHLPKKVENCPKQKIVGKVRNKAKQGGGGGIGRGIQRQQVNQSKRHQTLAWLLAKKG